jgi:hypothetical protein
MTAKGKNIQITGMQSIAVGQKAQNKHGQLKPDSSTVDTTLVSCHLEEEKAEFMTLE